MQKKAPRISSGALLCRAEAALLNFDKLGIARADHALRIYKAVHVTCDPAAVDKHEVRVPDQPELASWEQAKGNKSANSTPFLPSCFPN